MSQQIDHAMSQAGSVTTYAGAGTSVGGWLLSSEAGVLFGILIGVVGLAVNIFFKFREDRRLEAEHQERLKDLRSS